VVNVTWIEREFNACQRHRSMYPSIFNRFPVIKLENSKVRHFSSFFAHFGLPWVRLWDDRGKCHMDRKRIQCLSKHRSMYPSILNRFPVIQLENSKVRHFSSFFAHFGLPGYAPGTIAVNVTRLERGFNACKTPCSMYPSIFNHF